MISLPKQILVAAKTFWFYLGCILVLIVYCCTTVFVIPLLGDKKQQYVLTRFNVFVLWWIKLVCGIQYQVEGQENIPKGPCIVLCNHQSIWETFFLQTLFNPLSTVLKQELLSIPVFGWGAKVLKAIPLDRNEPIKAYKQLISEGQDRVLKNRSVLIFPEGTRVPIGRKVKFNRGGASLAHLTQVPIIPIAHNAGLFWPSKALFLKPGIITVRIGQPIYSSDLTKKQLYEESTKWIESNRDSLLSLCPS